jgi:hypothetical protein
MVLQAFAGAALVALERIARCHDLRLAVPIAAVTACSGGSSRAARASGRGRRRGVRVVLVVALAAWWWRELHTARRRAAMPAAPVASGASVA